MKPVFKYVVFNSNKQFVSWQKENPNVNIYQMQPLYNEGNMKADQAENIAFHVNFSIFVVYSDGE